MRRALRLLGRWLRGSGDPLGAGSLTYWLRREQNERFARWDFEVRS